MRRLSLIASIITDRPGVSKHDRRRCARGVRRAGHRNTAIGFLQRGGIIHSVAGHADDVAALLQDINNVELVFGKNLGEAVGIFDGLGIRSRFLDA